MKLGCGHRGPVLGGALAIALLGCACAAPPRPTEHRSDAAAFADELRTMGRADQDARKAWIDADAPGSDPAHVDALRRRVIEVDDANTARLRTILEECGWPLRSEVGAEAAQAAWLIAQHTSDDGLQARALEMIRPLLDQGEVHKASFALLEDRVRCRRGEPQLYGTQYRIRRVDGVVHFAPSTAIVDPEHLDERRAAMGLEPHAQYVATLRQMYHVPDDAVIEPEGPPPE